MVSSCRKQLCSRTNGIHSGFPVSFPVTHVAVTGALCRGYVSIELVPDIAGLYKKVVS